MIWEPLLFMEMAHFLIYFKALKYRSSNNVIYLHNVCLEWQERREWKL